MIVLQKMMLYLRQHQDPHSSEKKVPFSVKGERLWRRYRETWMLCIIDEMIDMQVLCCTCRSIRVNIGRRSIFFFDWCESNCEQVIEKMNIIVHRRMIVMQELMVYLPKHWYSHGPGKGISISTPNRDRPLSFPFVNRNHLKMLSMSNCFAILLYDFQW